MPSEPVQTADEALASFRMRMAAAVDEVPFAELKQMETAAYTCVATGAAAAFIAIINSSFFVLLAASIAIWRGGFVMSFLRQHPDFSGTREARGKVWTGRALAGLGVFMYLLSWLIPGISVVSMIFNRGR